MTGDQQPTSPGATDPRIEAIVRADAAFWDDGQSKPPPGLTSDGAAELLAAADAADQERHIVRVDTRDEALKQAVYDWITDGYAGDDPDLRHHISLVFGALAALRGEQP